MSDKRSVATDALETLGTIFEQGARDAIHLAVEPMTSDEVLFPGQDIGLVNGKASSSVDKKIGIVDPFLKTKVMPGQNFWMVIYPRKITSLRHVWSHPDFEPQPEPEAIKSEKTDIEKSWDWISDFAAKLKLHPDRLMHAADGWNDEHDYTYDNSEIYKDHWNEFDEFWKHYEIVRGVNVADKDVFFTCSC